MKFKYLLAVALLGSLQLSPLQAETDTRKEVAIAGAATAAGAAAGGTAFACLGSGGLVIAGGAVTIGAAPFIAAGAVIGLAGYGVYRVFQ